MMWSRGATAGLRRSRIAVPTLPSRHSVMAMSPAFPKPSCAMLSAGLERYSSGNNVTVHVPVGTWDESQQLLSWVDPFDMPEDDVGGDPPAEEAGSALQATSTSASLAEHIRPLNADPEIESLLANLGVNAPGDLVYVKEEDLFAAGVSLVTARKLLALSAGTSKAAVAVAKPSLPSPAPAASGAFDAQETMKLLAKKGILSAARTPGQIFCSSFLGGALLGWGCSLTTVVAGGTAAHLAATPGLLALLTGMVFPVGLSMVLLSGSELLTGNFVTMALPAWTHPGVENKKVVSNTWRVWGLSGLGNFAGSLFLAVTVYSLCIVQAATPAAAWLTALTVKKCALPPLIMIGKGACANWLVNVAIFQASSAHTTAGKIASLWFPIMTFVALGLEHSIANMFLLPLGAMLGADVSVLNILQNISLVACGNAVGAIIFVAGFQRYSLLRNLQYVKKA